jgi:bis(5'-nucleosyl)-tetraphosphatase (symmetrical)
MLSMSTYAIGDIQGCLEPLQALLHRIHWNPQKDTLWFCGDLFNRGPDPLGTLAFLQSLPTSTRYVLGNHDMALLAAYCGCDYHHPLKDTQIQILKKCDPSLWVDWLRYQPFLHMDEQYVLVHAGLHPFWDLHTAEKYAQILEEKLRSPNFKEHIRRWFSATLNTEQTKERFALDTFTRMRYCTQEGALNLTEKKDTQNPTLKPWFSFPSHITPSHTILFGHWSDLQGITNNPKLIALDTGCVWGGKLTAFRLNDQKRFSVS